MFWSITVAAVIIAYFIGRLLGYRRALSDNLDKLATFKNFTDHVENMRGD